ncbi:MAG: hypothetical protein ABEJ89_10260 [Haloarculaceae archaeon]
MAGQEEPDADDGKILAPEELDIADDEHVTKLDEGRYVVSPDVRTDDDVGPAEPVESPEPEPEPESETEPEPTLDGATVHEWLRDEMAGNTSEYGFDVTAKFHGSVSQQQMVSNDIVTVFESLMLWYARQLDGSTPVEEVLGILLMESNVPVRYPAASLQQLVESTDCSPEDSIADLLAAVDDDGVQL